MQCSVCRHDLYNGPHHRRPGKYVVWVHDACEPADNQPQSATAEMSSEPDLDNYALAQRQREDRHEERIEQKIVPVIYPRDAFIKVFSIAWAAHISKLSLSVVHRALCDLEFCYLIAILSILKDRRDKIAQPAITVLHDKLTSRLSVPPEDVELIDLILALYRSHEIPGDPVWAIFIDASGAGKTELLRGFGRRSNIFFLSKLTANSLVSGYRGKNNAGPDLSLLPQMDDRVVIIKDLSPLLEMSREARNSILGDLRDIYDGFTDSAKGNTGKIRYESRFTLIAGGTTSVEQFDSIQNELGERFIKFRSRGNGRVDKTTQALANLGADSSMRTEIQNAIDSFLLQNRVNPANVTIPAQIKTDLIAVADFTAKARSHVARDRNGTLRYHPRAEVGTRLVKELAKLLKALTAVRGKTVCDVDDLATIKRVADDCIPPNRMDVISELRKAARRLKTSEIADLVNLPSKTVVRVLDDMRELDIVKRYDITAPNRNEKYEWSI